MVVLALQLLVLAVLSAGPGYLLWRLLRRAGDLPAAAWVWCGVAGFCAAILAVQALVYVDVPIGRSAPVLFFVSLGALAWCGWQSRRQWSWRGEGRAALLFGGATVLAMAVHLTSLVGIGRERFLGKAQLDHVNYVSTAQFLMDERFSTDPQEIGLRPWLVLPLEWKEKRITSCVAVGVLAVVTGTDAQEAWGPTAVFFTGLLALALAGLWRTATKGNEILAAALGFCGAVLPGVTEVYLLGFFAQLSTLVAFPAVAGVLWPGSLPRRAAVVLAALPLGFLAGGYVQFWPLGLSLAGGAVLLWPVPWRTRIAVMATLGVGSLLLTSGYVIFLGDALGNLHSDVSMMGNTFGGWVKGGIGWQNWGGQFFTLQAGWAYVGVVALLAGLALAWTLRRGERMLWLLLLAGPAVLAVRFLAQDPVPAYPLYKLQLTFAPLLVGWAMLGWWALGGIWRRARGPVAVLVAGVVLAAASGALTVHRSWLKTAEQERPMMESFWAAKARAETDPAATYFIADRGNLVSAWLAYFGRGSSVYFGQSAIADRRVPSEAYEFRRPPGHALTWLDLDRTGPVTPAAPVRAKVHGAREEYRVGKHASHLLEGAARVHLTRDEQDLSARRVQVEFGLTPTGAGATGLAVSVGGEGVAPQTFMLTRATLVRVPVEFGADVSTRQLMLEVRLAEGAAAGVRPKVILQSLTVEAPSS